MKVIVFGAGGFIGGWICEKWAACEAVELNACARRWSSGVRLARRGVNITQVDLEEVTEDFPLLGGADVVVNVTVPEPSREPELALRLYSACAAAQVRKFIQFSSIAVYGRQTGEIDERKPAAPFTDYGRAKFETEKRLLEAAVHSAPQLIILRPSIVYGPFSENWTVRFAKRIANLHWASLGWAGEGICNLVHGLDVAEAVVLAATTDMPPGSHILNINGPDLVTWNEYIGRFGDALSIGNRMTKNPLLFVLSSWAVASLRKSGSWAKRNGMQSHLAKAAPELIETAQSIVSLYPTFGELGLFRLEARYCWEHAARTIGFRPSISLDQGLRQSAEWCRIHGILDDVNSLRG